MKASWANLWTAVPWIKQEDHPKSLVAGKAFYEANNSELLRRSLRTWAYYWRNSDSKLDARWRGPALICAIEPRLMEDGHAKHSTYWLTHGSSLARAAASNVRPEVEPETLARLEQLPDTALSPSVKNCVLSCPRPFSFILTFLGARPSLTQSLLNCGSWPPPSSFSSWSQWLRRTPDGHLTDQHDRPMDPDDGPDERREEKEQQATAEQTAVATNDNGNSEATPTANAAAAEQTQEIRKEEGAPLRGRKDARANERNRSRSPIPKDARAMAFESYNKARAMDGLPPISGYDRHFHEHTPAQEDQDAIDEGLAVAEGFNEKHLTPDQRKEFDAAKDAALQVWFEKQAWRPVPESGVAEGFSKISSEVEASESQRKKATRPMLV